MKLLTLCCSAVQRTYIACYFDEGNVTDSSKWSDPNDAADLCTEVCMETNWHSFLPVELL